MTNSEDEVIDSIKLGFEDGLSSMTPALERLFRLVYRIGYRQGQENFLQEHFKQKLNEGKYNGNGRHI